MRYLADGDNGQLLELASFLDPRFKVAHIYLVTELAF